MPDQQKKNEPTKSQPPQRLSPLHWIVLGVLGFVTISFLSSAWTTNTTLLYSQLVEQLRNDNVAKITIRGQQVTGELRKPITPEPKTGSKDKSPKPVKRFSTLLPSQVGEQ